MSVLSFKRGGDRRALLLAAVRAVGGIVLLAAIVQALALWGPQLWKIPTLPELAIGVYEFVLGDPEFAGALVQTLQAVLLSVLISLLLGVIIGLALGLSKIASLALTFPLELLRPVPAIAVIPVMILALGQGQPMVVAVTVFAAVWPLLFNTLYGVRNIEPLTIETARAFGLSKAEIVRRVVLPAMLPMVFTGLRIATPAALIVAVGAEYLATAGQGIGGVLIKATSTGDLQVLWVAAVVTGGVGLFLGGVVWVLGKLICPWSPEL